MSVRDTVGLALRNLRQAKLRTALTTMGVSIAIASLAGMLSLGVGLQDQFVSRFLGSGVFDAITVLPPRPARGRMIFGGRGTGGGSAQRGGARSGPDDSAKADKPPPPLDDEALRRISGLERVKSVYPNLRVPVEVTYGQFSEFSAALGVPIGSRGEGVFQTLAYGEFFTSESENACLLSLDLANRMSESKPGDLIGRTLVLGYAAPVVPSSSPPAPAPPPSPASSPASPPASSASGSAASSAAAPVGHSLDGGGSTASGGVQLQRVEKPYRIAGIVEREPPPGVGGGGPLLSGIMIPLGRAREIGAYDFSSAHTLLRQLSGKQSYVSVTVRVASARDTQDVEKVIKEMGYNAFSLNDALQGAKRAFIILDIILSLIGSIALAVSSLGIVNTMVMSILERTREIGIMKAIGGSDGDVQRIFLVEASLIGLIGGSAGIALGWVVGRAVNFGANLYIESQGGTPGNLVSLPWWLIAGALVFSVLISLIAGSYPAARAARLDPIRALRHE